LDDTLRYDAPFFGAYNSDTLNEYDALGAKGKPNAHYLRWKLNSLGYRGPELNPGQDSILCIGGSETFGSYESEDMEFPRQLEKDLELQLGEKRFQVVNVAFPRDGLPTAIGRLPHILGKLQPKLAVVYPSLANSVARYRKPAPQGLPQELINLRISEKAWDELKKALPESVQTPAKELLIWRATRHEGAMHRLPDSYVQRFRLDIERLIDMLTTNAVRPILVTHATRFGVIVPPHERPILVAWRRFYPYLTERGLLDMELQLNEVIRQFAREKGVAVVDAARGIAPSSANFADAVHFTDQGSAILAKMIADEVLTALRHPDASSAVRMAREYPRQP